MPYTITHEDHNILIVHTITEARDYIRENLCSSISGKVHDEVRVLDTNGVSIPWTFSMSTGMNVRRVEEPGLMVKDLTSKEPVVYSAGYTGDMELVRNKSHAMRYANMARRAFLNGCRLIDEYGFRGVHEVIFFYDDCYEQEYGNVGIWSNPEGRGGKGPEDWVDWDPVKECLGKYNSKTLKPLVTECKENMK